MRAGAEVGELALLIEAYDGVLGQVLYELDLVGLVLIGHELDGLGARQLEALYGQLLLAYLAHLGLYLLEHLGGEGDVGVDVVVEAVLDSGAYRQLALGIQALHRLGEDVARGVAVGVAVFPVLEGVKVFLLVHFQCLQNENAPLTTARGAITRTVPP